MYTGGFMMDKYMESLVCLLIDERKDRQLSTWTGRNMGREIDRQID